MSKLLQLPPLPYPPTINHYYGRSKQGHVFIKPRGKLYRVAVDALLREWRPGKRPLVTGRLEVRVVAFPPDKRVRDLDNLEKALWDALAHAGVFKNDVQIKRKTVEWGDDVVKFGKVFVELGPMMYRALKYDESMESFWSDSAVLEGGK